MMCDTADTLYLYLNAVYIVTIRYSVAIQQVFIINIIFQSIAWEADKFACCNTNC